MPNTEVAAVAPILLLSSPTRLERRRHSLFF
jgi:hypothetical protein